MNNYTKVTEKLERFIRKFYINELIKGSILFVSFGLLYFIVVVALEYFLWLTPLGRSFLFWAFVAVEIGLFSQWIIRPLLKLFKLAKGIDYYAASSIIGSHFPQVSDKLTNVLQLKENGASSELLIASIEQKAKEIQPIPFQFAINLKQNLKYAPYLVIPLVIFMLVWFSGKLNLFSESYQRVVDYKTAYAPPAPFQFVILNPDLEAEEGKNFQLKVYTEGDLSPEEAQIVYNNQSYFLAKNQAGQFVYEFEKIDDDVNFQLKANKVNSPIYTLNVVEVPQILNLKMQYNFPTYTQFEAKEAKGSGNAQVPEGTEISWIIQTKNTDEINFISKDSIFGFNAQQDFFTHQRKVYKSIDYQISTSNKLKKNYENLNFQIQVIKDEYPNLNVQSKRDSLELDTTYFQGKASDDYGLNKLQLVYYPTQSPKDKTNVPISIPNTNYAEFLYVFPNNTLKFEAGESYTYYFEVFDNDGVNGNKSTKSTYFTYRKKTQEEETKEKLNQQSESIKGMQKSLDKQKQETNSLKEIEQLQKEKNKLSFSDKKKIQNYLKRQEQQRKMMKNFTKNLKENLEKFQPEENDAKKEDLIERLQQNEERLNENEKLMEELDKYRDKLEDENLEEKIKQAANESKKQERTLEQLLELTKRYYVERKTQQIAEELEQLSKKQDDLSENEDANKEKQENLNQQFDELRKELEELEEENKNLKKPLDIFRDPYTEDEIESDMKEASELLEENENSSTEQQNKSGEDQQKEQGESSEGEEENKSEGKEETKEEENKAKKNSESSSSPKQKQKSAAEKMKELSKKMGASLMAGGQQQQTEDAETLKRILQNLLQFSFEQEDLMIAFDEVKETNSQFAKNLKVQADLRENFKHIDDSLFSLALRNQMIGEEITQKITDIQYNIEQSLERLADNKINLGQSNQQYVMTNANDLANLLDDALDNMQDQLSSGSGSGSSGEGQSGDQPGDQLSDIIKSHEELQKEMQKAMGKSPGQGEGEEGQSGETKGEGEGQSKDGGEGNSGENGNKSDGEDGGEGGKKQGEGNNLNEQMSGELYEIYKKQQQLKQQLEDRIESLGLESDARNLQKSLEQLEEELLMKGFSSDVLKQMNNIQHQLLKLKEAVQKQGEDEKRQATTNKKEYDTKAQNELNRAKEYFNTIEILNRQQLPLQPKYKDLIKRYFDEQNNSI